MSASGEEDVFSDSDNNNATYVMTDKKKNELEKKQHHPPYFDMVEQAISKLAGRQGVSKQKITDYIQQNYHIEPQNMFVKKALKKGLDNKLFENTTGKTKR